MFEGSTGSLSRKRLLFLAVSRYILAFLFIGLILFLPAGTIYYWNGWVYMGVLFIPMGAALCYLFLRSPELLEKRLNLRERQNEQKLYIKVSLTLFFIGFIIPGLDYRYSWSNVPLWVVIAAATVMLAGYILFVVVMIQNEFASRVIEIQRGQKVIDNGLYSIVRHPMYMSALVIFLPSGLVLGSYWSLIVISFFLLVLIYRIMHEEKFLRENLPGYTDYTRRVKYRLIPCVW